jgi:hypothetical protein
VNSMHLEGQGQPRGQWGHPLVDYPAFCSTTRVRVRHPWMLVRAWWDFRAVSTRAQTIRGLRRTAFLVQGLRTFLIFSLWDREEAMLDFATHVDSHHAAARRAFGNAATNGERAEIWSAQWKMWSVSNNHEWNGTADLAATCATTRGEHAPAGAESIEMAEA